MSDGASLDLEALKLAFRQAREPKSYGGKAGGCDIDLGAVQRLLDQMPAVIAAFEPSTASIDEQARDLLAAEWDDHRDEGEDGWMATQLRKGRAFGHPQVYALRAIKAALSRPPLRLSRDQLAEFVHRGRFDAPTIPPFTEEGRTGRAYCYRIADTILAGLSPSPEPQPETALPRGDDAALIERLRRVAQQEGIGYSVSLFTEAADRLAALSPSHPSEAVLPIVSVGVAIGTLASARDEALEEAARVAENSYLKTAPKDIATMIRALKSTAKEPSNVD